MSEYLKAAARCDITVVRSSPLPIDERGIIEDELRARQWDTLVERQLYKENLVSRLQNEELEIYRRREQDERARKARLEEKRKEALAHKELDRQARELLERAKFEELELIRRAAFERKQEEMDADRQKAIQKAQQRAYEDAQRRIRASTPKTIEEQAEDLPQDTSSLSYLERMRIEKERMGRMAKVYDGSTSVKALYKNTELPKMLPRCQLEMDITILRNNDKERLQAARKELDLEEKEFIKQEMKMKKQEVEKIRKEHEEWLTRFKAEEEIEAENQAQKMKAASIAADYVHPIDVIHKQVEASFLAEQEAEAAAQHNMKFGYPQLEQLEDMLLLERDTWRREWRSHCNERLLSFGSP